jgi:type I restriction enzyme M protein
MSNISATIKTIQNIMRKDSGVDGDAQRIAQLTWMLFLKIFSDHEKQHLVLDDNYISPISEEFKWSIWAENPEGITGDDLLIFVNNNLFPALKNLDKIDKNSAMVQGIFEDAHNYMKSGQLLRQIINKINEIDFNSSEDKHLFGDIYEQILKDLQSAGHAGEFYTPRAVTQFMVEMLNPRLGETILDPACGTGGFLACSANYLQKQVKTGKDIEQLQNTIMGWEKKQLPHILCTTNMILHGIDVPNIQHLAMGSLAKPLNDYSEKDKVDIILTNPPFGGEEEDGIEAGFPANVRTKETADLFLILIIKLLKNSGRCAMILPDGALFGEGGAKTRIKEELMTKCNLHTIIRLPKSVFAPYTSINTNLLFFDKTGKTQETWFYRLDMPDGAKAFNKTKPMKLENFASVREWWNDRKEIVVDGFAKAKKYSFDEIAARNFNLDLCGYPVVEEIILEPKELITQYTNKKEKLETEINEVLREIKKLLGIE